MSNELDKRPRRHRLSYRLLALFIVTGIVLVAVIAGVVRSAWDQRYRDAVDPHLRRYVEYILVDIDTPPNLDTAMELSNELSVDIVINGPDINWSSTGYPLVENDIDIFHRERNNSKDIEFGEYDHDQFLIRVKKDSYNLTFLTKDRSRRDGWGGPAFFVILLSLTVLGSCYWLLRWMLRPIGALDQGVKHIGMGELDYKIVVDRKDEFGTLATSINKMGDDLSSMLEAKRQLLLAISHELRSPLTRLKVSLALMDESDATDSIGRDANEMERLIGSLLEAERLNSTHAVLDYASIELGQFVSEVINEDFSHISIEFIRPDEMLFLDVDPLKLKLLLRNLLDNAIRHNKVDRGLVSVQVDLGINVATLTVSDNGDGMSKEQVKMATSPFWRPDSSRQRATGGFGLGLYLCQKIVEAHSGKLTIKSQPELGTTVAAEFPIKK